MEEVQEILRVALDLLDPHPHNPRGEIEPDSVQGLTASIKEQDVIEPLIVVPARDPGRTWKIDRYTVVAGHRRRVAAKAAGLSDVPVIVRDLSPVEQEEVMLAENIQRDDLSFLQEAKAFQRLIDAGMNQADVARRVGIDRNRVQQRLIILKLAVPVQTLFDQNELPIAAAPLLVKVESHDQQVRLARMIATRRLTVPKLEKMIDNEAERSGAGNASNSSSGNPRRQPRKPAEIYTRADAIHDLESRRGTTVAFVNLLEILESVCKRCGLKDHPEICHACPLPEFIHGLVKQVSHETHAL